MDKNLIITEIDKEIQKTSQKLDRKEVHTQKLKLDNLKELRSIITTGNEERWRTNKKD